MLIGTTLIAGALIAMIMLVPVLITDQSAAAMGGVFLSILVTLPLILVIWPVFLTRTAIELLKTVPGDD